MKALEGGWERQRYDGLNSLKYELVSISEQPLYTNITVALNETLVLQNYVDNVNKYNLTNAWIPKEFRHRRSRPVVE